MTEQLAMDQCTTVTKSFHLVGTSITANFATDFPTASITVQQAFEKQMSSIPNAKSTSVLVSPYMCNDIIATYFACVEVHDLSQVPKDMIGFTLPKMTYASIQCVPATIGEAYGKLYQWIESQNLKVNHLQAAMPIEIFYLKENPTDETVEILIPIENVS